MQTMPEGGWLCGEAQVEHLKVSYKIRVCLIKGWSELLPFSVAAKAIP